MNEVYAEWLVKKKKPVYMSFAIPCAVVLAVLLYFVSCLFIPYFGYIVGLIPFAGIYFLVTYSKIEYEYIYVNGELTIDKIIAQSRRKRVVAMDMSNIEMVADLSGHFMDGQMGNSNIKKYDYTSGDENRKLFGVLYSEGSITSIYIIEPSAKLIEAMRKTAPRKVRM